MLHHMSCGACRHVVIVRCDAMLVMAIICDAMQAFFCDAIVAPAGRCRG